MQKNVRNNSLIFQIECNTLTRRYRYTSMLCMFIVVKLLLDDVLTMLCLWLNGYLESRQAHSRVTQ